MTMGMGGGDWGSLALIFDMTTMKRLSEWQRENPLIDAEILFQGAEGRVYRTVFLGKETIVKERFEKAYRHPTLDAAITKKRILSEVRHMVKAMYAGIRVPYISLVDAECGRIFMERIHPAVMVKDYINEVCKDLEKEKFNEAIRNTGCAIGEAIAKLHNANLIHGDLTTSNMMVKHENEDCLFISELFLIDFGLSYVSSMLEDKAVDLYVLERAISSTHPRVDTVLFDIIVKQYIQYSKNSSAVLSRFQEVRARGRKRDMIG